MPCLSVSVQRPTICNNHLGWQGVSFNKLYIKHLYQARLKDHNFKNTQPRNFLKIVPSMPITY